jgi:hypothetical protein
MAQALASHPLFCKVWRAKPIWRREKRFFRSFQVLQPCAGVHTPGRGFLFGGLPPGGGDINSDGRSVTVSGLISCGQGSVLTPVQSRGREKSGGERTFGAGFAGSAFHRSASEPRGSLAFQPRIRVPRKFDWLEMAEGEELGSNVLLWMPLGLQGIYEQLSM